MNDNESFRLSGFSLSLPGFESIIPGAKKNLAADLVHAPVKPIPGKKQSLLPGLGEWLYHTVLSKSIVTKLTLVSNWIGASPSSPLLMSKPKVLERTVVTGRMDEVAVCAEFQRARAAKSAAIHTRGTDRPTPLVLSD